MRPWSHDASELNPEEIPSAYIYKNETIRRYLEPSSHERKLFLVGAKGCGKTLLLRYKAFRYWNKMATEESQGYKVSASNDLVESLDFAIGVFSRNELETLTSLETWKYIWEFSISLLAIRRLKLELPDNLRHLDRIFPKNFKLSNIVTHLITNQKEFITSNFFRKNLNYLTAVLNDLRHPFLLFVDRLDQALDNLLSSKEYKYHDSDDNESIPFTVWKVAQCGLLLSSYNFTTSINSHVKIFATARHEALAVDTQLIANITNYCTFLDYTRSEVREIFENNIKLTPEKYLVSSLLGNDIYEAFVGFKEMPHIQAKDEHNNFRSEEVFGFILRHTFERPREVVRMGKLIFENLLTKEEYHSLARQDKIERVRRVVNSASHDTILGNYISEIVPAFREEYIEVCANSFEQNLIPRDDLEKVDREIIDYLYRIGLIGYVVKNKQKFLPASRHINNKSVAIQRANYYMLHPSLDSRLQRIRDFNDFYNDYCIIGNGYPFYAPPLYLRVRRSPKALEYYLPKELPGKGTSADQWKRAKINVSAKELYTQYFINETDPKYIQHSETAINDALKVLNTLANLVAIAKVRAHFSLGENHLKAEEKGLKERLFSFKNPYEYSRNIKSLDRQCLDLFEARLFGRFITAGALAYLDIDYFGIKQVVQHFSISRPASIDKEEASVKFLRQAFFIANLPNNTPNYAMERRKLLEGLSDFERELLRRWWWNYKNHVIFEKVYLDEAHIRYLKKIMKVEDDF